MTKSRLCPPDELSALVALGTDAARRRNALERALGDYPGDARLLFLQGSWLAAEEDFGGARAAMRRAVDLAPDFAIARFQLGLLLLTSGEPYAAQEAWGPLQGLSADHYLRSFVSGLCHMIRDEFDTAVVDLEQGIARNQENEPLNRNMQLVVDTIRERPRAQEESTVSSVDMLLREAARKSRLH